MFSWLFIINHMLVYQSITELKIAPRVGQGVRLVHLVLWVAVQEHEWHHYCQLV